MGVSGPGSSHGMEEETAAEEGALTPFNTELSQDRIQEPQEPFK